MGRGFALPQTPTRTDLKKMNKLFLTILKSYPRGSAFKRGNIRHGTKYILKKSKSESARSQSTNSTIYKKKKFKFIKSNNNYIPIFLCV